MKKLISLFLVCILCFALLPTLSACYGDINRDLDLKTPVTIRVVGSYESFQAMSIIADEFHKKYPNCTVVYERLQDYYATLQSRLALDADAKAKGQTNADSIDIFITSKIQKEDSDNAQGLQQYALELFSQDEIIDLTDNDSGLIKNFTYTAANEPVQEIYSVPLGADMRILYVNKTLLNSLDIAIPTNLTEFTAACAKLLQEGYVPIQGNPGSAGQQFLYPYFCNCIVNAEDYTDAYNKVNTCAPGVSEIFRDAITALYNLVDAGYYNYKVIQNRAKNEADYPNNGFNNDSYMLQDFLNLKLQEDGSFVKSDNLGNVAFLPSSMVSAERLAELKNDYESEIEYETILAPLGASGYAYVSPAIGVGINKNSSHTDWACEFLDFLLSEKYNIKFAEAFNIIPNIEKIVPYVSKEYNIPQSNISTVGQVSFDYNFYDIVKKVITDLIKFNNPSYINDDEGNKKTIEYFMAELETAFQEQAAKMAEEE